MGEKDTTEDYHSSRTLLFLHVSVRGLGENHPTENPILWGEISESQTSALTSSIYVRNLLLVTSNHLLF